MTAQGPARIELSSAGAGGVTLLRRRGAWKAILPAWVGWGLSLPFLVLAAALIVFPFVQLIATAMGPPGKLGNFGGFLQDRGNVTTLTTTVVDSLIVAALALLCGGFLAWILRATRRRLVRTVILLGVLAPLWMGGVMKIYAFSVLLERNGIVNKILIALGFVHEPVKLLYTQPAVIAGLLYYMIPFTVLPLYSVFLTIDDDLLLASQILGASRARAVVSIVLPLATPGLIAAGTVVFIVVLGYFLTPVLLGGTMSPFTSSLIEQDIFSFFQLSDAAVASCYLLVVAAIAIGVSLLLLRAAGPRRGAR